MRQVHVLKCTDELPMVMPMAARRRDAWACDVHILKIDLLPC
eukprot:SAG31_NODE_27804_length_420_cov_0.383178_1_plen_41_part_01